MTTFIDKLAFIDIKDKKVLVTLSKGNNIWYIPGGKREAGESDFETLIREVKEELSVDLDKSTIKKYGVFKAQAHGKPKGTYVRMTCYTAKYLGQLKPNAEIEKFNYLNFSQVDLTSPVDHLIFKDLRSKGLII